MSLPEKKELSLKFTGDLTEVEKSLEDFKDTLKGFGKVFDGTALFSGASKQLQGLSSQVKSLKSISGQGPLFADVATLSKQFEAGILSVDKYKRSLAEVIGQAKLANNVQYSPVNDKEIANAVIQLKQFVKVENEAGEAADKLDSKVEHIGNKLSSAFLPLAALGAAAGAALKSSAENFETFEKTLNTVAGVAELTDAQVQKIKESSLQLGQSTTFNAQQVAQSYLELSKAGFTAEQSIKAMPGLLNLAAAAGGDLSIATQAITESLKGFGLGVDDIQRFSDVLAKTANKSSSDLNELVFAFKQVGPLASQLNQPLEDTAALLGVLANASVKGADAGSDLREILLNLSDTTNKKAVAALKELGVTLFDAEGKAKPLTKVFQELQTALKPFNQQSRTNFAQAISGSSNIKSFIALTSQAPGVLNEFKTALDDAGGSTDKLANRINQGLFKSLEQFGGVVDTIKNKIGEALAPAIERIVDAFAALGQVAGSNPVITQFAAGALAATAVAISLGAGLVGLTLAIGALDVALAGLGLALAPVALGFGAVVVAAGLATIAFNKYGDAVNLSKQSQDDLKTAIRSSGDAITNESKAALSVAKSFDTLAAKSNKTKEEKQKLHDIVLKLSASFPSLLGQIDDLTGGYTKLEQAIKNATAQKLAFDEHAKLDAQLKSVNDAIDTLKTPNVILNALSASTSTFGAGQTFNVNDKKIQALQKQRLAIKAQYDNIESDVTKQIRKLDKLQDPVAVTAGTKQAAAAVDKAAANAAEKRRLATEELAKEIRKIETDLTGFQKGEYAKREAEALKVYEDEKVKIDDLAKRAGISLSSSTVQAALTKANLVYANSLKEIQTAQKRAVQDSQNFFKDLRDQITNTRAQITTGNPFDDLTAQLVSAQTKIDEQYQKTVRQIQDASKAQGNTKTSQAIAQAQTQLASKLASYQRAQAKQTYDLQVEEQARALASLVSQNKIAQATIQQDTIAAAKATHDQQIQLIDNQIKDAQKTLDQANKDILTQPDTTDAQNARALALEQIKQFNLQKVDITLQADKQIADIEAAQALAQLNLLKAQIELEGQKPELIQAQIAAYDKYISRLKVVASLQGDDVEKSRQASAAVLSAVAEKSSFQSATSSIGKAIDAFSNLSLGSGFLSKFQSATAGPLKKLTEGFQKFQNSATGSGKSFLDFIKTAGTGREAFGQLGSNIVSSIGGAIAEKQTGLKKALTTSITGALSGALSGFAVGGPIGAAIGGAVGLVGGAASGGFFKTSGGVATAFALGGVLGFFALNAKKQADKLKKQQQQLEKAQKFISATLVGTDKNDLASLQGAITSLLLYSQKNAKSGPALQAVRDQVAQLQQAMADRKLVVAEAIKQITLQNSSLSRSLGKFNDNPLRNLTIDEQNQIEQLTAARDSALDQYKDSLEAQALIEQQFNLQRQQLFRDTAQSIIDEITDEQNAIRSNNSQAAVNLAQSSGDQLAIIRAQLSQQLTAIDNDLAAFKGSEQEKTSFLALKASERTLAIKQAQDQQNAIVKQGLDILNEGLVTSVTKADDQQTRLKALFGNNLNTGGLITTADGQLTQSNIAINAGAVQLNFSGAIADAQSLIDQLTDPVNQAKLLAALNAAISRT